MSEMHLKEIHLDTLRTPLHGTTPAHQQQTGIPAASFKQMLMQSVNTVNDLQHQADQASEALASGQDQDIHKTMIAMEKADIAFRLLMQIRNKVVEAYETIMRMAI